MFPFCFLPLICLLSSSKECGLFSPGSCWVQYRLRCKIVTSFPPTICVWWLLMRTLYCSLFPCDCRSASPRRVGFYDHAVWWGVDIHEFRVFSASPHMGRCSCFPVLMDQCGSSEDVQRSHCVLNIFGIYHVSILWRVRTTSVNTEASNSSYYK